MYLIEFFESLKKRKNTNIHFDKVASFPRLFNNLDQDDPPQQPTPGDHLENYFPENKKGSPPLIKPMFDEFKSRGITTGRSRKRINRSSVQPSPRSPAQDYQGMKSDRSASRIPPKGFEHENDTFASIPNRDTPFPATSIYPPYDAVSTLRKTGQTDVIVDRAAVGQAYELPPPLAHHRDSCV